MKKFWASALGALAMGWTAGTSYADPLPTAQPLPEPVATVVEDQSKTDIGKMIAAPEYISGGDYCNHCPSRFWASSEYLNFWLRRQNLSVPVVATATSIGNFADDFVPSTTLSPLAGPGGIGNSWTPGARITAGLWLDPDGKFGVEGSGFWLARTSKTITFASDASGSPFLGIPFVDQNGQSQVAVVSVPAGFPGTGLTAGLGEAGWINLHATTQLWGAEANGILNLWRNNCFRLDGLGGFRYLNLEDTFSMQTFTSSVGGFAIAAPVTNTAVGFINGSLQTQDFFRTQNQFYGGQVGLRGEYQTGKLRIGLSGKLALGNMNERLTVNGNAVTRDAAGNVVSNQDRGYFAMPNNSGTRSQNEFCLIPEFEIKGSYALTNWLSLSAGYDFLYVNRVARAASQLDNNTDSRLQIRDVGFNPNFQTNVPSNDIRTSSFWAQGVTVGLEFRW